MTSFREFRQTLLLYYDVDLITDEDFVILYELFSSRNPDFGYDSYDRFDLGDMNEDGRGAALKNCFGFVDGTVRPIARPDEH